MEMTDLWHCVRAARTGRGLVTVAVGGGGVGVLAEWMLPWRSEGWGTAPEQAEPRTPGSGAEAECGWLEQDLDPGIWALCWRLYLHSSMFTYRSTVACV